jgi:hypothetical protein
MALPCKLPERHSKLALEQAQHFETGWRDVQDSGVVQTFLGQKYS